MHLPPGCRVSATAHLAEIEARVDAATGGPWRVMTRHRAPGPIPTDVIVHGPRRSFATTGIVDRDTTDIGPVLADARLIAHARADLPTLTGALRAVLALHRPDPLHLPANQCEAHHHHHDAHVLDERERLRVCTLTPVGQTCHECHDQDGIPLEWPCPTTHAIDAALGDRP